MLGSNLLFRLPQALLSFWLAFLASAGYAASPADVRFQFDWRFEGSSSIFLNGEHQGFFADEGLRVRIDSGSGSANTVNLVASGAYDMGFADLATLMEFHGNNPGVAGKPVAVMVVYNTMPAAVFALKKSGIQSPTDLKGRTLGAPVFDAGRRAFPLFAAANGLGSDDYRWESMDPTLRENLLVRGDIDAITGFHHSSLLNLVQRGVSEEEIVVFPYGEHGVAFYGSAIIASPAFLQQHPDAVRAFLRAFTRSVQHAAVHPDLAIAAVKSREPLIDDALELQRLKLLLDTALRTSHEASEGFGRVDPERLEIMARQVAEVFGTEDSIDTALVWDGSFLPEPKVLTVFAD